jgi:hypothetical protein
MSPGQLEHGNDADGKRRDCKDAELNNLRNDNADHAAFDNVYGSDGNENERVHIGR